MPGRGDLEALVEQQISRGKTPVLEALYILSLAQDGAHAREGLRLRYQPVEAAQALKEAVAALDAIGAWGEDTLVWDRTTDTQELCRDVLRWACEPPLARLQEAVEEGCSRLSRPGRQLVFLLIREGSVQTGNVEDTGRNFGTAHRIIFGEDLLQEAFDELVSMGLLYKVSSGYGTKYAVPNFARRAWEYRLEQVVRLPRIELDWPAEEA